MTTPSGVEQRIKKQRKQPKLPCQMEMEVDRISNLPGNIVDKILSLLPLRDAVRSSILSSKWRYNWANLTSLVFDQKSLCVFSGKDPTILAYKVSKIVDHVLLLHNGPIHKFKLLDYGDCDIESDIDRWILFLSRRSVKEFILEVYDGEYELPSSLSLWDKLSHLQLSCCSLKPSFAFNGFKILTNLDLSNVLMDQDVLENLIYMCPLLERLTLRQFCVLDHFKIHAPRLTFFDFRGVFEDVTFENTVHLSTVSICFNEDTVSDYELSFRAMSTLIKFFASLPSIQSLDVDNYVLGILAGDTVPKRLPTPCIHLNYLFLDINFDDMEQCVAALCILRSSPNLMELKLISSKPYKPPPPRAVSKNLMELEDYEISCCFNQLRLVNIADILGVPRELNFINFLLANSPILERMTVNPASQDSGVELLKELLQFRRASTRAKIIYLDP